LETLVHYAETIERDKPLEPVVNGFALNGKTVGSNHSSMGNGHMQPNGLLMHANTITITGNPLDVAGHDKVCVLTPYQFLTQLNLLLSS
jgi:hypothetical protein